MNSLAPMSGGGPGRRRIKTFLPAALEVATSILRVHILNISTTGALCHAMQPPAVGTAITLKCKTLTADGVVVWVKASRFGIKFRIPVLAGVVMNVAEEV